MKHSPYNSKHVVFIYDVCLKNIAQAASLVLYCMLFAQIAPQNARGFSLQCNVCAIMFPFISYTYFNDIKQRLSAQLLFKFQLMPFFKIAVKF